MNGRSVVAAYPYRDHAQPTEPERADPLPTGNTQADRVTRRAAFRRSFELSADGEDYLARRDRRTQLSNQS